MVALLISRLVPHLTFFARSLIGPAGAGASLRLFAGVVVDCPRFLSRLEKLMAVSQSAFCRIEASRAA